MDELLAVPEAARQLGVTPSVLIWLHRRGVLDVHKRVGVRSNLVRLDDARRAVAERGRVGWPKGRPRKPAAQAQTADAASTPAT